MNIRLISILLEHFKCHEHLEIRFDGKSASIYGRNGSGKSSVYDGLTWLLFGKDSQGKKEFEIKPLTAEGQVKDHEAITSVEAVLLVDGVERRLKRTYYEVWSTRRGSADAAFDGHSSDYFVDGVPCKKSEFSRKVGEMMEESTFRLLTGVGAFASELPWQQRRAILFDMVSLEGDEQMMEADSRFAPLAQAMDGLSLEDYRKKLMARRKELNGVRTDIPARLDECKKTVSDLAGLDFRALEAQKDQAQQRRDQLWQQLNRAREQGERPQLENQLAQAQNQLAQLENENQAHRLTQQAEQGPDPVQAIRQSLKELEAQANRRQREQGYLRQRERQLLQHISHWRARWDEADRQRFQGGLCPACGQALPADKLERAKAAFEAEQQRQKRDAVQAADQAKAALAALKEEEKELERQAGSEARQAEALARQLEEEQSKPRRQIRDLAGYEARKTELEARQREIRRQLEAMDAKTDAHRMDLRSRLADIDWQLEQLNGQLAQKATLEYAQARMEQLRAQAAAAAEELNRLDQMLYLWEQFVRYKACLIEGRVNRLFSLARFRLFRQQVNGGLEDCCDVTVDGVPYASGLNTGARVNAGIDIINALSRHYGIQAPLFIDNAESVTRLERAEAQIIRLVVSEEDEELRCVLQ